MQKWHFRSVVFTLAMVVVTAVSLTILGCGGGGEPLIPPDTVNANVAPGNEGMLVEPLWTFGNGNFFDPDFAVNEQCTFDVLSATPNPFTLTCGAVTAEGEIAGESSCRLTYTASSSADTGPQQGEEVVYSPCRIVIETSTCDPALVEFDQVVTCTGGLQFSTPTATTTSALVDQTVEANSTTGTFFINGVDSGIPVVTGSTGG